MVAIGSLLTLSLLALGFNVAFRTGLNDDAEKILRARATAALDTVSIGRGGLTVSERPQRGVTDTRIWVYDGMHAIERATGGPAIQGLADELSQTPPGVRDDPETETRLLSVPVLDAGRRVGTVVSALSVEPYERSESRALLFSVALTALTALLVIGIARLLVDRALQPVTEMTMAAAEWTEHDLSNRFDAGEPRDELTMLAATFDGMLDRLAGSLRKEQRFTAEVSHELRTPLAAILAEAELALRRDRQGPEYREALARVVSRAKHLQRILETLLIAERVTSSQGRTGSAAREIVDRVVGSHADLAAERGVSLGSPPPAPNPLVQVDGDLGERILSPLVENACRYARSRIQIEVHAEGGRAAFVVSDDGRGVHAGDLESIFEPGWTGEASERDIDAEPTGAGLGLALSRRLARSVGGEVRAVSSATGGRFEATLPVAREL